MDRVCRLLVAILLVILITPIAMLLKPMKSDVRAPKSRRENSSRPISSVPSQPIRKAAAVKRPTSASTVRPIGVPMRLWRLQDDAFKAIALRHEHVSCPTAVFRRSCVDAVGGFDPQFTGLGCEDRDLWLRIAERWKLRYLDTVAARYRVHGKNMSGNRERMGQARRRLVEKLAAMPRGAALARHAGAMIDSDLGDELLAQGDCRGALRAQLRALRRRPLTQLAWRRLLRTAVTAAGTAGQDRTLAGGMQ